MFQLSSSQKITTDVWSNEWLEETLATFSVPGEMEWELCDFCRVPTHIHVARWTIIDNKNNLLCKQCQNKNLC